MMMVTMTKMIMMFRILAALRTMLLVVCAVCTCSMKCLPDSTPRASAEAGNPI